ncbi:hypothetical protein NA56DRAFT_710865 [Hyaloscypha hepaticicola]|uniref:Uncharacterized protein n=1 Tax=Hyaloscypha hepaticicola TaxID=2082293 RepID=A0A2J6PKI0_9HELO|nr:hypothetical protein NA56DRAFT_710865 [Hyaloscypha hepaticicola]
MPDLPPYGHNACKGRLCHNHDLARRAFQWHVKRCHHRSSLPKIRRIRALFKLRLLLFWRTLSATEEEAKKWSCSELGYSSSTCTTTSLFLDGSVKQEAENQGSGTSEVSQRFESQPRT